MYANTVMSITKNSRDDVAGTLLYVSPTAYDGWFRMHDVKLKNIQATSDSLLEYEGETLGRYAEDGTPFYAEVVIQIVSENKPISRDKVWMDRRVGNKTQWRRILPHTSDMAYVCYGKGMLALEFDKIAEAARYFRVAAKYRPEAPHFCSSLAWQLATSKHPEVRQPQDAVALASYACQATSDGDPSFLDTLAAAHAATGEFDKAAEIQEKAVERIPLGLR
ncbi:MAG: hypothetical protein GXY83_17315 [Rhodopirellula sp.]|nr:hypothetical protein [Rhodopirellula sp.]